MVYGGMDYKDLAVWQPYAQSNLDGYNHVYYVPMPFGRIDGNRRFLVMVLTAVAIAVVDRVCFLILGLSPLQEISEFSLHLAG